MLSKEKSLEKIRKLIGEIDGLEVLDRANPLFKKWIRDTQVALEMIFGKENRHVADFNKIRYSPYGYSSGMPQSEIKEYFLKGLNNADAILSSMIDEIEDYWDNDDLPEKPTITLVGSNNTIHLGLSGEVKSGEICSKKIFVVHGHDAGTKEMVARFLSKLDLEPIILHEQVTQGKTIIEKFEDHADVGYAVVLITPDDTGASIKEPENIRKRARQNVIFEFGYFLGKLGRNKVIGLVKGDIELPSDYSGVLSVPIDEQGAWRFQLVKELKSVGYDVDANKAI